MNDTVVQFSLQCTNCGKKRKEPTAFEHKKLWFYRVLASLLIDTNISAYTNVTEVYKYEDMHSETECYQVNGFVFYAHYDKQHDTLTVLS